MSPGSAGSVSAASPALTERDLKELAAGIPTTFGTPAGEPVFLVCTPQAQHLLRGSARRSRRRSRPGIQGRSGRRRTSAATGSLPTW